MSNASNEHGRRLRVLRQLSTDYARLRAIDGGGDWPDLALVAVTRKRVGDYMPHDAQQRARTLYGENNVQGWVRHRSLVYRLHDGSDAENSALRGDVAAGPPIAGEWAMGNDRAHPDASVHLRPEGGAGGKLAEWHYGERMLQDSDELRGDEFPALRQRVTVIQHPWRPEPTSPSLLGPVLVYHVFWGTAEDDDPHALRRLFARFVGFDEEDVVIEPGKTRSARGNIVNAHVVG
jgi:hypothetical protein